MGRGMRTTFPPELGSGPRTGGRRTGPFTGTWALWKGRPPILNSGYSDMEPGTLVIAATGGAVGDTVTINFEGGNGWGGVTNRTFQVGQGLSAQLQAGSFQHVVCRTGSEIPADMLLSFSWIWEPVNRSPLYNFQDYPIADVNIDLPEGAEFIIPESAGQFVFQLPQFSTTFTKSFGAGEEIPAYWGAFSCNTVNKFIFKLRGI